MILIVFNKSESNLQILENVKKKLLVMTLVLSRIQVLPFTEEQLKLISNGEKSRISSLTHPIFLIFTRLKTNFYVRNLK